MCSNTPVALITGPSSELREVVATVDRRGPLEACRSVGDCLPGELDAHRVRQSALAHRPCQRVDAGWAWWRNHVRSVAMHRSGVAESHVVLSVPIVRLDPDLPLPSYAHPGDAGLDLRAREDGVVPSMSLSPISCYEQHGRNGP